MPFLGRTAADEMAMSATASGPPPLAARLVMWVFQAVGVTLAGMVVAVISTSVWWRLTPQSDLDVLVYDQTVPDASFPEHAALGQILDYHRVPFDIATDYVGAAPGGRGTVGTWPEDQPDLIILADAYGVYLDEDGNVNDREGSRVTESLTPNQAADVADWVHDGVPAYAEFALVTEPTPGRAGQILEQTFGFQATGWMVRKVDDLSEVSPQIKSLGAFPWPYDGPGIILLTSPVAGRTPARTLVVLTQDMLEKPTPDVLGGPPGSIAGRSPFHRWIGVVEAAEGTAVDAWFELPVNNRGAAVLDRLDIPVVFPALIRTSNTLYFAGNGLSDETPFRLRRLQGGATLTRLVTGQEFRFFYQILEPSMGWLLYRQEVHAEAIRAAPD